MSINRLTSTSLPESCTESLLLIVVQGCQPSCVRKITALSGHRQLVNVHFNFLVCSRPKIDLSVPELRLNNVFTYHERRSCGRLRVVPFNCKPLRLGLLADVLVAVSLLAYMQIQIVEQMFGC